MSGLVSSMFTSLPATLHPQAPAVPAVVATVAPIAPVVAPSPTNLLSSSPTVVPVATPGTAPNGVVPAGTPVPAADPVALLEVPADPNAPKSPLDAYAKLWENDPSKNAAPAQAPALDPEKLKEVIGKANFSASITPENMKAITEGGEGATAALIESLNTVAQQTMVQATLVSNKLIEQALEKKSASYEASLPELIRKHTARNSLVESNPVFSNPAVVPVMEAAQSALAVKFPTATSSELTKMTQDYIKAMGEAFNPAEVKPAADSLAGEDWEKFMTG